MREFFLAFFGWFNQHEIAGFRADVFAHLFVGGVLYFILVRNRVRPRSALFIVTTVAVFKELTIDLSANLTSGNLIEPLKDIFLSVCTGLAHLGVTRLSARRAKLRMLGQTGPHFSREKKASIAEFLRHARQHPPARTDHRSANRNSRASIPKLRSHLKR